MKGAILKLVSVDFIKNGCATGFISFVPVGVWFSHKPIGFDPSLTSPHCPHPLPSLMLFCFIGTFYQICFPNEDKGHCAHSVMQCSKSSYFTRHWRSGIYIWQVVYEGRMPFGE
jgi:hypothetical protein